MADSIINTFDKGLHQDSTFILQPDGTYRNMKNGMLISHDGNHYVIELSKGNKVLLTLPKRYFSNNDDEFLTDLPPMPIGFVSFIDKLAVFFTNNESENGGYGEIGLISFVKTNGDFTATYTPYYHHPNLNFTKRHKIEGFSFKENDDIERVYWSDNLSDPRVFDFKDPIFTTYIGTTSLVVGKYYMVIQGIISHDGNYYGPSSDSTMTVEAPPYVNSNVFIATTTTWSGVTGPGGTKVIEYYPIDLLSWTPSRLLGDITFDSYGSGSVNCGEKIYFYRLSKPSAGIVTSWSYASNPIQVLALNNNPHGAAVPQLNNYHNIVGAGSSTTLVNSERSVNIRITNIDTNFEFIEIACAEFNQATDIPYSINIVNKEFVTDDEMIIEHTGNVSFGTVTVDDLSLFPAAILRVKTLTTSKNYSLIANITEREEFDIDLSGVTIESFEYPLIAHGDIDLCSNNMTYDPNSPALSVSPGADEILPFSRWLVSDADDTSNRIEYPVASGDFYYTGDVIVGVVGSRTFTYTGTAKARPCVNRNRYTPITSLNPLTTQRNNSIEIKTGFWNYKDPAVASHCRGYWSNEKYRLAVLFFDKKGNPFYARHIGDFTMPTIDDKGGLMKEHAYVAGSQNSIWTLNPSGIKVSNLEIPEDIIDKISGFSIVRAERDVRIVLQGLVMQVAVNGTDFFPISTISPAFSAASPNGNSYYVYIAQDYNTGYVPRKAFGTTSDSMEEAAWLNPENYAGYNGYIRTDLDDRNLVAKLFEHAPSDSDSLRKVQMDSLNGVVFRAYNENANDPNFDGLGNTFDNTLLTHLVAGPLADDSCTGNTGTLNITAKSSRGDKKLVFKTLSGFNQYGPGPTYNTDNTNPYKILMNYVKDIDPMDQYGGDSDSAIAETLYISTGHFQPINEVVKAETDTGAGTYRFDDIEVFGGDCYVNLVDHVYGLYDVGLAFAGVNFTIFYPCEHNNNVDLRRGRTPARNGTRTPAGPGAYSDGIVYDDGAVTQLEDYSYNLGYTTEGLFLKYPALPVNFRNNGVFRYRVRFAGQKFPGELTDSFRTFLTNDYRDLDGQLGQINNIRSKDGRVTVFQDHGVSSVPILERQVVSGADGDATTIGTGGVIDRFDPISTYYGNQHQHGLTETEYGYFWFDMRRRALCIMGSGGGIQEISLVKGLQVFFNNQFDEGDLFYDNRIYNTNISESQDEIPLMGYGIIGVYDPRFKMSYLTFKYAKQDLIDILDETISITAKDFTIGYSHVLNAVIGFYDFTPGIFHNHNDLVLSANNHKNYKYLGTNMAETTFNVGDVINVDYSAVTDGNLNGEYICIKQITYTEFPISVLDQPQNKPEFWTKINDQSQIYLQTFNTHYLKFYGKVYNHELEIIVNPKSDMAVSYQNMQVKGMGSNYTDVQCDTDDQSASDLSIPATSRNYRLIDKAWYSNFPLPSNGRLTDYYLKVKMTYKGYVSNPTVSKNVNKVVQFIKSFFIAKY